MSEIRATTISDAAGTGPITLTKQSAAKAWVHSIVTSGTPALSESFNVLSITDSAIGTYNFNLSSAMSSATFSVSITTQYTTAAGSGSFFHQENSGQRTTTIFGLNHYQNGTTADPIRANGQAFGDLA